MLEPSLLDIVTGLVATAAEAGIELQFLPSMKASFREQRNAHNKAYWASQETEICTDDDGISKGNADVFNPIKAAPSQFNSFSNQPNGTLNQSGSSLGSSVNTMGTFFRSSIGSSVNTMGTSFGSSGTAKGNPIASTASSSIPLGQPVPPHTHNPLISSIAYPTQPPPPTFPAPTVSNGVPSATNNAQMSSSGVTNNAPITSQTRNVFAQPTAALEPVVTSTSVQAFSEDFESLMDCIGKLCDAQSIAEMELKITNLKSLVSFTGIVGENKFPLLAVSLRCIFNAGDKQWFSGPQISGGATECAYNMKSLKPTLNSIPWGF